MLHDCTLNNNGHKSLPKSAENADSYVNLHTAHLPEVLLIPASVPNDEESIAHCIAAQRIAEVA